MSSPLPRSAATGPHRPAEANPRRRRLLIVAMSDVIRERIAADARRLPGASVALASTRLEAQRLIEREPPDLILSNLTLPDVNGLELFSTLTGFDVPVSFMSSCLRRFREHLGHLLRAEDPRTMLDRGLQCDCSAERKPMVLGLADVVVLSLVSGRPMRIELLQRDRVRGVLFIRDGVIRQAQDHLGDGREAFERLLRLPRVLVTCRPASFSKGEEGDARLGRNWRELLLTSAPTSWISDLEAPPADAARDVMGLVEIPLCQGRDPKEDREAHFSKLLDAGIDAVLDHRLDEALEAFREAKRLRPKDPQIEANLARLRDLMDTKAPKSGDEYALKTDD